MTEVDKAFLKYYGLDDSEIEHAEEEWDFREEDSYDLFKAGADCRQAEIKELQEAIKHFNPCCEWDNDVHDCEFRHYVMEYGSKLTKAKEIIKKFSEFVNNEIEYDPEHPQEHTDLWNELCKQAEQFLSEVEKR